jgi:hypothetical protein
VWDVTPWHEQRRLAINRCTGSKGRPVPKQAVRAGTARSADRPRPRAACFTQGACAASDLLQHLQILAM